MSEHVANVVVRVVRKRHPLRTLVRLRDGRELATSSVTATARFGYPGASVLTVGTAGEPEAVLARDIAALAEPVDGTTLYIAPSVTPDVHALADLRFSALPSTLVQSRPNLTALDVVLNGSSLTREFNPNSRLDWASPFGWLGTAYDAKARMELLLKRPPELPSGRVPILVCAECGDLGCGSLSVRVVREAETWCWLDFAWDAPFSGEPTPIPLLGPFRFAPDDYVNAVRGAG